MVRRGDDGGGGADVEDGAAGGARRLAVVTASDDLGRRRGHIGAGGDEGRAMRGRKTRLGEALSLAPGGVRRNGGHVW